MFPSHKTGHIGFMKPLTIRSVYSRSTSSTCRTWNRSSAISFSRQVRSFTNEKLELALTKLSKAVGRLAEAVMQPPSPIQSDAVLQRFEFTFELCWKALRIYLAECE